MRPLLETPPPTSSSLAALWGSRQVSSAERLKCNPGSSWEPHRTFPMPLGRHASRKRALTPFLRSPPFPNPGSLSPFQLYIVIREVIWIPLAPSVHCSPCEKDSFSVFYCPLPRKSPMQDMCSVGPPILLFLLETHIFFLPYGPRCAHPPQH